MIDVTGWPIVFVGSAALVLLAVAAAWWLRAAGAPGGRPAAGLLGGVAAGLVLGATLLGRLAPTLYEKIYPGGAEQAHQLDLMKSQQVGEIALLQKIGATEVAIDEQRQTHERELEPIQAAYDSAIAAQTRRWTIVAATLACAWFLLSSVGSSKRSRRREGSIAAPIASGVGSALLAGVPTFLLTHRLLGADIASSVALACALGAGGILTETRTRWSGQAGRAPSVDLAGAVALTAALVALIAVDRHSATIAVVIAGTVAIVLRLKVRLNCHARRIARGAAMGVLLPAMTALALAQIDVIALASSRPFWIALLIAAFLASDGRWLGGWLGWWSCGRGSQWRQAWTRSAAALAAGAGGSQVAIALVALSSVGAATSNLLGAGVFAALLLELLFPIRRRVALMLDSGGERLSTPSPPGRGLG